MIDLVGALIDGRYKIQRKLGAGGMGVVWQAHQESLTRDIALKTLISDEPELVERFQREGRALSRIRHENVVTVFDSGRVVHDGTPVFYIAMELASGETLRRRLARGPLPLAEGVAVIAQIVRGLEAAHAAGVVHRDIKPENAMFDRDVLKLVDFGIARALAAESNLTRTGGFVGTPGYTAPEVALGASSGDGASDLYAVGALAFDVLAGNPVFSADNGLALAVMHAATPAPRLSSRVSVPPALDDLVDALLAKDPARRPTARGCLAVLTAVAAARAAPPSAPPIAAPSATPRPQTSSLAPDAHTETGPSVAPPEATDPGVRAAAYENAWVSVHIDHTQRLVRVTRNHAKLSINDVDAALAPLVRDHPAVDRVAYALLFDLRAAPPNNSDAFTARAEPLMNAITMSYRHAAVLVRSAAGILQVSRSTRAMPVEVPVYNDEAQALAALAAREARPSTRRR